MGIYSLKMSVSAELHAMSPAEVNDIVVATCRRLATGNGYQPVDGPEHARVSWGYMPGINEMMVTVEITVSGDRKLRPAQYDGDGLFVRATI